MLGAELCRLTKKLLKSSTLKTHETPDSPYPHTYYTREILLSVLIFGGSYAVRLLLQPSESRFVTSPTLLPGARASRAPGLRFSTLLWTIRLARDKRCLCLPASNSSPRSRCCAWSLLAALRKCRSAPPKAASCSASPPKSLIS